MQPRCHRRRARRAAAPFCLALAASTLGCSDLPTPPIGTLEVALSSGVGIERHRLAQATFELSGDAELKFSSDEAGTLDVLERPLPEGSYELRLLDGWQLLRLGAEGETPVRATLVSGNPVAFDIFTGAATLVSFEFETVGSSAPSGGTLRVGIAVDGVGAPALVITEVMRNPEQSADTAGEWIELHNAGPSPLDLTGCSVSRGEQAARLEPSLVVDAGAYVTLANGANPGFTPTLVYRGLTLPNTGPLPLRVECAGHVLDAIVLESTGGAARAGRSASLSASRTSALDNDLAAAWCEATTAYGADFGTPGAPNPECP